MTWLYLCVIACCWLTLAYCPLGWLHLCSACILYVHVDISSLQFYVCFNVWNLYITTSPVFLLLMLLYLLCILLHNMCPNAVTYYWECLTITSFWLRPLMYCVALIWGGTLPSKINSLGRIQVCKPHIQCSEPCNYTPSQPYLPYISHPMQVEVQWLGMFLQSTYVLFCALVT